MKNFWFCARSWFLTAFVALVVSGSGLAAGPSVTINSVRQRYPWNGLVDIDYTVTSNMTLAATAYDNISGAALVLSTLSESGSANPLVAAVGTHRLTWNAAIDAPSVSSSNVVLTLASQPLYLVVDLTTWKQTSLNTVPAGGWTDEYKTTKLVLRRIDSGTFYEANTRTVSITQPFYVGIFELTQKQWNLVMGTSPSSASGDTLPVENVSYDTIRGTSSGASWPAANTVDAASFMGVLRAKTGLVFDLPTEAQWEFACRAGTTSLFNNGSNTMDDVGWYYDNATSMTHSVGLKVPNAWGLYDMHGNVWEWCLDWYAAPLATNSVSDPVGATSGSKRLVRGGCYQKGAKACTSANRLSGEPATYVAGSLGLRVACPSSAVLGSATFRLDTLSSPRVPAATETITYGPRWDSASSCSVTVTAPDSTVSTLVSGATSEGSVVWTPPAADGLYTLRHIAGSVTNTAQFVKGGLWNVTVAGGTISDSTGVSQTSPWSVPAGTVGTISAPSLSGRLFAGWTGDTEALASPSAATTAFTVSARDVAFTAFYTNAYFVVTVTGGFVTDGVRTNTSLSCAYGSTVTLVATNAFSGTFFWSGTDVSQLVNQFARTTACNVSQSLSFTASSAVTVTVVGGTGGGEFAVGTSQAVSAPAVTNGQVFAGWLPLDAPVASRLACTTTLTVPDTNYVLTASYAASVSYDNKTTIRSGLYAGVLPSDTVSGGSINELGVSSVSNRADYPLMADQALSSSFAGWGEKTNWVYWGQMQLSAGTYRFAECFDDVVLVMINNKYLLRSRPAKNGEAPEYADFTAPSNGWYDVRFVFYNDTDDAGARVRSDWGNAAGLVFRDITSLSGTALTNFAAFASLSTGTYRTCDSADAGFFDSVAAFYGLDSGSVSGSGSVSALTLTTNGVEFVGSTLGDGNSVSLAVATSGNGSLSFSWLVSSESGLDVFSCTTNGAVVVSGSGTGNAWSSSTNYVTDGGSRSWIFTYAKSASGSAGQDAAWLKDVVWTAGATPPSSRTNTLYSPVSVPYAWLDQYGLATGTTDDDYENAATNTFANGYTAWASYLAGLDPTNATSIFYALISISNNAPVVTWTPDLGSARVYTVLGKTNLTDPVDWFAPTNAAMHFFKVEVEMP